jgi:hypothetical protein
VDISAGTKQKQQAADFPNGVPCASDASMKNWMGYVYQQKPLPSNFTGVEVTVDVLDSNGNYRNIGTATTDATGTFSLTWTPDIAGNYSYRNLPRHQRLLAIKLRNKLRSRSSSSNSISISNS